MSIASNKIVTQIKSYGDKNTLPYWPPEGEINAETIISKLFKCCYHFSIRAHMCLNFCLTMTNRGSVVGARGDKSLDRVAHSF